MDVVLQNRRKSLSKKSLGVLLPALNEEGSLEKVAKELLELPLKNIKIYLLIINDGSIDKTGEIADDLSEKFPNIDVIHNSKPKNIGNCYKKAIQYFRTDFITWLPTDGEIDPNFLLEIDNDLYEEKIIISYPAEGSFNRGVLRKTLSKFYQWLMNKITGHRIRYYNASSIFPLKILKNYSVRSEGFTINAELVTFFVSNQNYPFKEIEFKLRRRMAGKAKALSAKYILNVIKSLHLIYVVKNG